MSWIDPKLLVMTAAIAAWPVLGSAKPPLSASDWLSGTVQEPSQQSAWRPGDPRPKDSIKNKKKDLARTGSVEPVGVTRLGANNPDSLGTVSARTAGLAVDLWGSSDGASLARQVLAQNPRLPALRRLLRRVLAARLNAPAILEKEDEGALFLARADKLLDMGATGAAQELLQTAGPSDPDRFRRLFDIALLSANEAQACEIMDMTPGIAPSFPARIFCLALGGDWAAASLVQYGAETLGQIDADTARLMSHFLDDGYADSDEMLPPPATVTPLLYRLHEAVGQPLPVANLPLAFSLFDLDDNGGWKAQLEAAERLARAGAIPASQLRDIYLSQAPAASGGVWDRVSAVQALETALAERDSAKLEATLPPAYKAMRRAGLAYALADMAGAQAAALAPKGEAGQIAIWLALSANQAQTIEQIPADADPFDRWLITFAGGSSDSPPPNAGADGAAPILMAAFGPDMALPASTATLIRENRHGEALLAAIASVDAGLEGDTNRAAQGLRSLIALDQGDIARQAAVEILLQPRLNLGKE